MGLGHFDNPCSALPIQVQNREFLMNADIQDYAQAMPQYREALNFLQAVLDFQAKLETKEISSQLQIKPAVARERWRAGQPLLAGEPLSISPALFQEALAGLRPLLPAGETAQTTLDRLLASGFLTAANVETLLDDLIAKSETSIQQIASATSTDPDTVAFLLHTVLSPFFKMQAAPYQVLLQTAAWRRGICPICGSEPGMARLTRDNGRRVLTCSLCLTEWAFDRLRCPFCESGEQPQLRYFTVDGDEAHRVDCCNRCHHYLKTVDERAFSGPVNLQVEDVITAHLDTLAQEQGYR